MLRTKTMDRVCCAAVAVMIALSVLLWGAVEPVRGDGSHTVGYEGLLFDQSTVHTIDITMDGWDEFIANATAEEYVDCNIVIDGEKYNHVAIRVKGNTSLSSVATLGSTRYSFKVEFDHFVDGMTYHGLDKMSLNNLIQDATMMKDYLAYTLMNRMGVPSSLCSYVQINVNGEPWGLYLAVEGVEDSFMDRNGMTKGELYKPDSLSFGGGRGNGGGFDIEQFRVKEDEEDASAAEATAAPEASMQPSDMGASFGGQSNDTGGSFGGQSNDTGGSFGGQATMPEMNGAMPQGGDFAASSGGSAQPSEASETSESAETAETDGNSGRRSRGGFDFSSMDFSGGGFGGFNFGMGSEDVKLIYSDDDPDSYSNIFNNAKTDVSKKDKARLIESIRKLNAREDLDSVVNKQEVINYLAVHNFLCNDDSYTGMMVHNYYLYEEKGQLSIIPWDYNLAFGGFSAGSNATSTVNSPIDSPVSSGTVESRPLIGWIFSSEETLTAYHEAYDRFITENIESGWLEGEIERVQAMITPYLEKDDSTFYDMDEFSKAVDTLKTFCAKRGESIRGQLDGDIPSTSAGQRSSSALIDASEISTSDMGSMNGMGGGGGGFSMPGGDFNAPEGMPDMNSFSGGTMPEGFQMPEGVTLPEGFTIPEGAGQMPTGGDNASFGGSTGTGSATATPQPEPSPSAGADDASFGGSAGTSSESPAQTPPGGAAAQQPEETPGSEEKAERSSDRSRGDRSQGMPSGMRFPGQEQQNQSGQWIQLGVYFLILLAAILVIRRVGSHN